MERAGRDSDEVSRLDALGRLEPARGRPRPGLFRARGVSRGQARRANSGQSLVEFALVLTPLLLLLLGIIQFGFVFNTYVTITNATRDAAREGTIYVYDRSLSKDQNDQARNERIRSTLLASLNYLSKSPPQLTTSSSWLKSGSTYVTGDLIVAYVLPTGMSESDPRTGQQVTVTVRYHQDLLIPMISQLLPTDGGGRLVLSAQTTMVVN